MTPRLHRARSSLFVAVFAALTAVGAAGAATVPVTIGSVRSACATRDDSTSVLAFLRDYEATLATGRMERIADLYVDLEPTRRVQMAAHFRDVISDLRVHLDDIRVAVEGEFADIDFARTDHFRDRKSGLDIEKTVSLSRRLVRQGTGWQILLETH